MERLLRLARAGLEAELSLWRDHARRRAGLVFALVVFLLLAVGFATALGVVALARWLGPLAALAIALGVAILICLILLIALHLEARAHARRAAARAAERRRFVQTAALSLLPELKGSAALAVGLAVLALTLLTGSRDKDS